MLATLTTFGSPGNKKRFCNFKLKGSSNQSVERTFEGNEFDKRNFVERRAIMKMQSVLEFMYHHFFLENIKGFCKTKIYW